jgi:hypothetical protein
MNTPAPSYRPPISAHRSSPNRAQTTPELHQTLPGLPHGAIPEIGAYFSEAWGSRARIDYGSGMELNFLCWLSVRLLLAARPRPHLSRSTSLSDYV